ADTWVADHCRDRGVAARVGDMMGELVMEALATLRPGRTYPIRLHPPKFREAGIQRIRRPNHGG
ncbi:MAG TPA: hypothetical protein VJ255_05370, partial [Candidatus Acidoferrum sp.]|nr:hypothetical protein [Candidatus Acidoferrum sp.]